MDDKPFDRVCLDRLARKIGGGGGPFAIWVVGRDRLRATFTIYLRCLSEDGNYLLQTPRVAPSVNIPDYLHLTSVGTNPLPDKYH